MSNTYYWCTFALHKNVSDNLKHDHRYISGTFFFRWALNNNQMNQSNLTWAYIKLVRTAKNFCPVQGNLYCTGLSIYLFMNVSTCTMAPLWWQRGIEPVACELLNGYMIDCAAFNIILNKFIFIYSFICQG